MPKRNEEMSKRTESYRIRTILTVYYTTVVVPCTLFRQGTGFAKWSQFLIDFCHSNTCILHERYLRSMIQNIDTSQETPLHSLSVSALRSKPSQTGNFRRNGENPYLKTSDKWNKRAPTRQVWLEIDFSRGRSGEVGGTETTCGDRSLRRKNARLFCFASRSREISNSPATTISSYLSLFRTITPQKMNVSCQCPVVSLGMLSTSFDSKLRILLLLCCTLRPTFLFHEIFCFFITVLVEEFWWLHSPMDSDSLLGHPLLWFGWQAK